VVKSPRLVRLGTIDGCCIVPSDYELLKPFLTKDRKRRIEEVLARRTDRLVLVLENLYDPHNLSAILRTAEAMGIQHLYLTGAFPDILNPDIAIGADRWLTLHREPDPAACLGQLREGHYLVAGSALSPESVDPGEWEPQGRVALVLGNEHEGISETFLRGADLLLRIPMTGFTQSFNVSVAAAMMVGILSRKKFLNPRGLPPDETGNLRDLWAKQSIAHADEILSRLRRETT
jgi:tRNA (guanosine-2'-O-)-methyltransferase